MRTLQGKVAVVTGGATWVGLAVAKHVVEEGGYVFIAASRQTDMEVAVRAIGTNVTGVRGDATNIDDLRRLYAVVERQKGKLDVVFASAGLGPLDASAVRLGVQEALPLLVDGGSVTLASSACGATAVLRRLAGDFRADLSGHDVRVNVVNADASDCGRLEAAAVARAVAFLASHEGASLDGLELVVEREPDRPVDTWRRMSLCVETESAPALRMPARSNAKIVRTGGSWL
jgi:hypothetical protein